MSNFFVLCALAQNHKYRNKPHYPKSGHILMTSSLLAPMKRSISSKEYWVVIHPNKCEFVASSLRFLGHVIDGDGIRPLSSKVSVIQDLPHANSQSQLLGR